MKKTILTAIAAVALLLGGNAYAQAQEPCYNANECAPECAPAPECTPAPECPTSECQAQQGYETIGQGTKEAAEGSYNVVKEGAENAYEKTKEGVETGYEKAKEGTVNLWNKTKEKIHEATE